VNFGSGLIRAAMRSGIRCRNNQPAVRAWLISCYGLSLWQVRLTADDVTLSMVVARWGEPPALSADLRFGGPWSRSRGGKRLRSKTWCLLKTPRVCVCGHAVFLVSNQMIEWRNCAPWHQVMNRRIRPVEVQVAALQG
jgi:hypothetical protein